MQASPASYASPQRLLTSRNAAQEDGGNNEDDDEFVQRYLRDSPVERSVRRRETLSPSATRRSNGIPPRPPSLPGTIEKRISRGISQSTSRSVFGSDDIEMNSGSDDDDDEADQQLPEDLDHDFGNESPVLKFYEEMEQQRSVPEVELSERIPINTMVRKLDFRDDVESPVNESQPFATPPHPASSASPRPSLLSDFLSQPTYVPQYASPISHSLFSSDHHMDLTNDSATSSPSVINELSCHKQEVCGLRWSFDEKQLASGGNDNKLFIWNISGMSFNERSQQKRDSSGNNRNQVLVPEHQLTDHTAAVKAIAWSPHQHGLLVSGGGTADRHMRFWNTQTGLPLQALDTGSQVRFFFFFMNLVGLQSDVVDLFQRACIYSWVQFESNCDLEVSILTKIGNFNRTYLQVVSYLYPSLSHPLYRRVLYLAMSPNGQSIVTGAGDETLRFWNVFPGSKTPLSNGKGMLLHSGGDIR